MRKDRTGGADPFQAIAGRSGIRGYDIKELALDHTTLEEIPEGSPAAFPKLQCLFVPFNKLRYLCHLEKNPRLKSIDAQSNVLVQAVGASLIIDTGQLCSDFQYTRFSCPNQP
jgi:hypothetical protein